MKMTHYVVPAKTGPVYLAGRPRASMAHVAATRLQHSLWLRADDTQRIAVFSENDLVDRTIRSVIDPNSTIAGGTYSDFEYLTFRLPDGNVIAVPKGAVYITGSRIAADIRVKELQKDQLQK